MTIVVGLSSGEPVPPAVRLGAMLARATNQPLVVTAVVAEPWPPDPFRSDEEFLFFQVASAEKALDHARAQHDGDVPTQWLVRRARSVSSGLAEAAAENKATCVVLGSSSTGALNRVAIGGVADRILHTSGVPVAVAPRRFAFPSMARLSRVTVAFGRGDGDSDLLAAAAARASDAGVPLRVACFAVRPTAAVAKGIAGPAVDAENLVTERWVEHLTPIIFRALGPQLGNRPADISVGQGASWAAALADVPWRADEILVVGTSSSPVGRLFLGSHAAKIVRNSLIPVVLVPRSIVEGSSRNDLNQSRPEPQRSTE